MTARDQWALAPDAPAPRPWTHAPVTFGEDVSRIYDSRGEEIGRMRTTDAVALVAIVNASSE